MTTEPRRVYCAFVGTKSTRVVNEDRRAEMFEWAEKNGAEVYSMTEEYYNDPSGARYGWDGPTFRIMGEKVFPAP